MRDNVCTYFNLVFLVLAVMLALVHSWLNMGFLGIVFWNTLIGIVQQLRAKRTIDKLTLVSAQKLRCLRDGRWCEVLSDDLVQDDVVEFGAGDQIAADASCWTAAPRRTNPSSRARRGPFPRSAARS